MTSGVGLIPEQAWENENLAATPYGTLPPECASIGFVNGKPAGSTSPLTWSEAQYVRLSANLRAGRITEQPVDTTKRYITNTQQGIDVTLDGARQQLPRRGRHHDRRRHHGARRHGRRRRGQHRHRRRGPRRRPERRTRPGTSPSP